MAAYFIPPTAPNTILSRYATRPNVNLNMPFDTLQSSVDGPLFTSQQTSPSISLYSDYATSPQMQAAQLSDTSLTGDKSPPAYKFRRLSDSSAVSSNPSEPNYSLTSTKTMAVRVDIVGVSPRNMSIAEKYAVEGVTEFACTETKPILENSLPILPQWRGSVDIPFFEDDFGGGFDPDGSTSMQLRQIHQSLIKCLGADMVYIDKLLIEIFASHKLVTDYDLIVISPSRDIWTACQELLIRKLISYIFHKDLQDTEQPLNKILPDNFINEIVHSHFIPIINRIKTATTNCVAYRKMRDRQDGKFAADYEPSRKEIDALQTIPQCAVRGVGWNGSTRAWVASWLPPDGHKRVCATYSTRKFGYHRAMKLAICQRLRAELFVYRRRKYPVFLAHEEQWLEDNVARHLLALLDEPEPVSLPVSTVPLMPDEALEAIRELEKEVVLNPDNSLIIISFELPFKVTKISHPQNGENQLTEADFTVSRNNALLLPALHQLRSSFNCNIRFIGFCGYTTDDPNERKIIRKILDRHDCTPVFPTQDEFNEYVRFCFQFLSPIFHSIIHLDSKLQEPFNQHSWMIYQSMNKLWADQAVLYHTGDSDIIWVHDFHLLLVPQYLSRRYKRVNIGLFLHVPFPACDVFRCLPVRVEIIRGMLCADLVGFHFFEYARHFFIVCKKLLGLDQRFYLGGFLGVEYGGRNVMVKIGHVNVEYGKMRNEISKNNELLQEAKEIRQKYKGKIILGAVDKCEELAGLSLKLRAIKFFVEHFPYAKNKVVLVQYAYPTRAVGSAELTQKLLDLANRINTDLDPKDPHIVLKIQAVPKEMKWALLVASDCLFDTSIRDGLNLTAFEYIACRGDRPSHMILSEFTGCSTTLTSAKRINPWSLEDVAAKLDLAVSAVDSPSEKWARDQNYLSQNSLEKWAKSYLGDLQRARKTGGKVYLHCGFASTYRVLSIDEDFRPLNVGNVVSCYRKANRRLLFLDHEGTLAPDRRHLARCYGQPMDLSAMGTPPSPRVRESITKLCQDPDNVVVIFSGRDRNCLEQWFGEIPNLSLCAEHGYFIRSPSVTRGKWECLAPTEDFVWKQVAFELMSQYVKRTQGSFLENKGSALVFQYRDADPDFGSWQAKQLAAYLGEFLFNLPVNVVSGKGYVEARIGGVSKGLTAEHLIQNLGEFQFILCIGDDQSDEEMFAVLNRLGMNAEEDLTRKRSLPSPSPPLMSGLGPRIDSGLSVKSGDAGLSFSGAMPVINSKNVAAFSVTVGKKPSQANYYLNDTEEVSELLAKLEDQTNLKLLEGDEDAITMMVNPSKFVEIIEKSRIDLDQNDAWRTTML